MSAKVNIMPLADRVLVKPGTGEDGKKTKSGIIIPETVDKERPEQGKVIAVGEGRTTDDGKLIPLKIKVGDVVIFSKYGPDEVNIDGEKYYILREEAILAIIK
jgi:chaperonin GroES